jgi:hypothetical protein
MNEMNAAIELKPLIHIGYPKTASTWLQEVVFPDESLGFTTPWGNRCALAIDQLVLCGPYNFSPEEAIANFKSNIHEPLSLTPVISDEILVGDPIQGKYWGKMIADRLVEVFPSAKVLICIREQKSYMLSAYKEYIRSGGTFPLQRFIGHNLNRHGFTGIIQKNFLEYDTVISYYQNLFGKEKVLILPFEMLRLEPQFFLDSLLDFSTNRKGSVNFESERSAYKGGTVSIRRILNNYIPQADWGSGYMPIPLILLNKFCSFTDKVIPKDYHAKVDAKHKDIINAWVGDDYRASNKKTSSLTGLDLASYGYDV